MLILPFLPLVQEALATPAHEPLNALGVLFMLVSVGFVTLLTAWCFYRVLSFQEEPPQPVKDLHSA